MLPPALVVVALCITVPAQADLDFCVTQDIGFTTGKNVLPFKLDIPAGQTEGTFDIPFVSCIKVGAYASACDGDKAPEVELNLDKAVVRRVGDLSGLASLSLEVYCD